MPNKYRFDDSTETVYLYSPGESAYIFIGNLNGRSHSEFIRDYERGEDDY